MSDLSYKKQKEDFVSNLTGGSVSEIAAVTAIAPVAILLWSVLQARHSFFKPASALVHAVDFAINVGAFLLATTLYADRPVLLILLLLAPAAVLYIIDGSSTETTRRRQQSGPNKHLIPMRPFVTAYRGAMMIMTCVSILAVDFRLFPRRFAKVETWGTSLMDMGVGSFVFGAGVVAARPILVERASGQTSSLASRLLHSARHSTPLLVLGLVRLLSVKGLDYAEHVSEYGVHWNFFFTLAFLPPFVAACRSVLRYVPSCAVLSLLIATLYELLLDNTSLKAYVLTAPRRDLLSMNREGIFSLFGYLAIFLAGQDFGILILPRSNYARSTLLLTMAVWASIWSALYLFLTSYKFGLGLGVSRRIANLPYVTWVAAFNTIQLLACCAIETVFFPAVHKAADARTEAEAVDTASSRVLRAYNRNGLAVFLVANLFTGLVNMSVRTLDATPAVSLTILLAYMGCVTAVAVGLDAYNVSIKL